MGHPILARLKMRSILFLQPGEPQALGIEELVRNLSADNFVEVYRTVHNLEICLRSAGERACLFLLFASDKETLTHLLDIGELLRDLPLVIVISSAGDELVAMAHKLRPRYLHNIKEGLDSLSSVLKKMSEGGLSRTMKF